MYSCGQLKPVSVGRLCTMVCVRRTTSGLVSVAGFWAGKGEPRLWTRILPNSMYF